MAIAETWKFNENIGKIWNFEGVYGGVDESQLDHKGVAYVLMKNIVESGTGEVFRDHTYISVSRNIYDRYFRKISKNTTLTFKARTYHYEKGATGVSPYLKVAVGLTDMMEVRIKRKHKPKEDSKGISSKNATIGWLLHTIKDKGYKTVEYQYPKLDKPEVTHQLAVDVVNTLLKNRGNHKDYNLYVFRAEGVRYRATLSLIYPDYSVLKSKDIKRPNYRNKRFKNSTEAYSSEMPLEKGKMVLTIVHEDSGEIRDEYYITVNNSKQYSEALKMVVKYFKADLPKEELEAITTQKGVHKTGDEYLREITIIEPG